MHSIDRNGMQTRMNREDVEQLVRRAAAAFNERRPDEARRLCEAGLIQQPNEPTLNHLLAAVLFAAGATADARQRIDASLSARPGHAAALLLAARIARAEQDFAAALGYLDDAIRRGATPALLIEKARLLDQTADHEQRRSGWQAVLDSDPRNHEAMAKLGRAHWEAGDAAEAERLLRKSVEGNAPASTWFDLGLARQDLGDLSGATAAYRHALGMKPDFAEAAVNLGVVQQEAGDLDGALESYGLAYRLRPTTFGTIAMALTSGHHGRLWLDEDSLRRSLGG
jgi:tetratricopeptide (TPR) repeat protein